MSCRAVEQRRAAHGHRDRLIDGVRGERGPQRRGHRPRRRGRVDDERVDLVGRGQPQLEQVLAARRDPREARAQPVAREQRPDLGLDHARPAGRGAARRIAEQGRGIAGAPVSITGAGGKSGNGPANASIPTVAGAAVVMARVRATGRDHQHENQGRSHRAIVTKFLGARCFEVDAGPEPVITRAA